MKDFELPDELKKLLTRQKLRGTIVFFKGKAKHYSSVFSSSSSSDE